MATTREPRVASRGSGVHQDLAAPSPPSRCWAQPGTDRRGALARPLHCALCLPGGRPRQHPVRHCHPQVGGTTTPLSRLCVSWRCTLWLHPLLRRDALVSWGPCSALPSVSWGRERPRITTAPSTPRVRHGGCSWNSVLPSAAGMPRLSGQSRATVLALRVRRSRPEWRR